MEPKRQREIALGVVVVALLATAIWRMQAGSSAGAQAAPTAAAAPQTATQRPAAPSGNGATIELDLAALEAKRPLPQPSTRDPFRFKPLPPPPPPPSAKTAPVITASAEPPGPPPPPRITLKFIGVMSAESNREVGRVAVLSDTRGGVFYGREGEIIEGQYRILKIGVESLEIAYLDGRGRQTIRQTGQ